MTTNYCQIRMLAGMTQDDVAAVCNVNRRTVARFERGLSQNPVLQSWYEQLWREENAQMTAQKEAEAEAGEKE